MRLGLLEGRARRREITRNTAMRHGSRTAGILPACRLEGGGTRFRAETADALSRLDGVRSRRRIYLKRAVIQLCSLRRAAPLAPAPPCVKRILDRRRPRRQLLQRCFARDAVYVPCPSPPQVRESDVKDMQPTLGPPASSPARQTEASTHRGWRSRGYLPHCDDSTLIQHIVFGLADAVPRNAKPPSAMHGDRLLDQGRGECLLRTPACASIVEETLLFSDGERYKLLAWCVMPNHVHVIAVQSEGWALEQVVQAWKSASAHRINRLPSRRGRLWRREYFDRFMRDDDHLSTSIAYVEENPVRAGLASTPACWPWSSARRRIAGEDAGGPR